MRNILYFTPELFTHTVEDGKLENQMSYPCIPYTMYTDMSENNLIDKYVCERILVPGLGRSMCSLGGQTSLRRSRRN